MRIVTLARRQGISRYLCRYLQIFRCI